MGLAWVAKAQLQAPPQSLTPVGSSVPKLGDNDSFLVMLSNRFNQTREVSLHPVFIITVLFITSVIFTTITNTDGGYHVSDIPRGLMMLGSLEQWVPHRTYRWLAPSFCFVSNMGAQHD